MAKMENNFLHHVNKLNTPHTPHVVAATVDDEDVRCCSSSQGVGKEGKEAFPPQSTPAEPADADTGHAEVSPHGFCSSLGSMSDIAVPNYPNCTCVRRKRMK